MGNTRTVKMRHIYLIICLNFVTICKINFCAYEKEKAQFFLK